MLSRRGETGLTSMWPTRHGLHRWRAIATVPPPTSTAGENKEMAGLRYLILTIIDLYWWVIIVQAVMSWLVAFGVINTYNKFVAQVGETLYRLTEPVLGPIRRFLPDLGGLDISPVIAIIALQFIRYLVVYYGVQLL